MTNEKLEYEDMTLEERGAALKVRRVALDKSKAKGAKAQEIIDLVSDLQIKHDCKTVKGLPQDARLAVMALNRDFFTKEEADAIEAYWAGGAVQ